MGATFVINKNKSTTKQGATSRNAHSITAGKTNSCQTRGFVHDVPASGVTATPTATTERQERNVYAVRQLKQWKQFGDGMRDTTLEARGTFQKLDS